VRVGGARAGAAACGGRGGGSGGRQARARAAAAGGAARTEPVCAGDRAEEAGVAATADTLTAPRLAARAMPAGGVREGRSGEV
jgi:hypothetical protein